MTERNKPNLVTNAYMTFDNFILDRANEVVKAWNWTTGRTRADLADITRVLGTVPLVYETPLTSPMWAMNIFLRHYFDQKADNVESSAGEVLPSEVKVSRQINKLISRGITPIGGALLYEDLNGVGIAGISFGLAGYIMRADYQKPRKDCVRRGIEKLSEIVKTAKEPALKPAPIRARYEKVDF